MSPETPANIETTLHNTNTSHVYQNSLNTKGLYVEISQPQPHIELTHRSLPSSPICSPLRQKLRRAAESYEDLIGDSSIPNIPNNLSSPNSPDYNIRTPDSIWTLIYRQANILYAHTEQLKDLQPTRFEGYDRNLDTLFKRADAERRIMFDLRMKVGEIKDKSNQELGNLDSRIRYARRETRSYTW
ncbi:hypothetical protein CTI12_AA413120 [Artemisia annua]|uniref:Uncharacterized protein n=1 Tax=Artemisia annua TaxID=35608 RepID=A0A2U1M4T2_ARTAN|nr:hypothetical protein CTI12_AA413120 [Artemisia annua]